MTAFALLRALVYLRRIVFHLQEANSIAEARLKLEKDRLALDHPEWLKSGHKIPKSPKFAHLEVMQVEDINKRYKDRHPDEESY